MEQQRVDVGAIVDSASFLWKPFGVATMMILITLTDGFDLFIPSYVAPALIGDWGITRAQVQPFVQAGLFGMALGSVALGRVGDRIGRRKAFVACLALLSIGSVFCYFARSVSELFLWRVVMGLGLGGVTPLATTLVSEWTNQRVRNVAVAAVIVSIPLGGTLAGFIYRTLEPEYGWRSMFAVGAALPVVLLAMLSYWLPESPKYMAKRPRAHPALAKSLNRLLREQRFNGTEAFFVVEDGRQSQHWFATLLNQDFRVRTALIWVAFAVNSFVLYLFTGQIPLLLTAAQFSADASSSGLQYFSAGAMLGSVGGAALIGRYGSRHTGTVLAAMGGVASVLIALLLYGGGAATGRLFLLCLVAGASVNGMQAFMYAVSAHAYPTEVRGAGVGAAQTVSRIGAVAGPAVAAWYFSMEPTPPVGAFFLFMAAVTLVTTLSFYLIPSHIPAGHAHS
jgi:AAHS family 4-hydroxybenzoate transporter-like MFS transporter